MERGALVAVSMRMDSSRCSGGVSSEASATASAPLPCPPPAVSRVLEEQPQVRGQEVAGPVGHPRVTASSFGGGSTCLAWNGSDGRNS